MVWGKGLDVSFSSVSLAWCQARKAEGYQVAVQCLWTGGYASNAGIKAVAASNLQNLHNAGLITTAYVNATPPDWWPIAQQMREIKTNAGAMWSKISTVFVDVEIVGTTKARVIEMADALKAEGKNVQFEPLYTGRWFWAGHMANDKDPIWKRFKLWNAYYDSDPDIDFGANSYGPWTVDDLMGEQYQGTTNVGGVSIDLNQFNLEYFTGATPPTGEGDHNIMTAEYDDLVNRINALTATVSVHIAAPHNVATAPPSAPTPAPAPAPAVRTYKVVSGDSLSLIAQKALGNAARWPEISRLNGIAGPNYVIYPGQVLRLP